MLRTDDTMLGREDREKNLRMDSQGCRCKIPVIDDEDSDRWQFRVERYFAFNRLSEGKKVEAAPICFTSNALTWFQYVDRCHPAQTWKELKSLCLSDFVIIKRARIGRSSSGLNKKILPKRIARY